MAALARQVFQSYIYSTTYYNMADPALRAEIAKGASLAPTDSNDRSAPATGTSMKGLCESELATRKLGSSSSRPSLPVSHALFLRFSLL